MSLKPELVFFNLKSSLEIIISTPFKITKYLLETLLAIFKLKFELYM